MSKSIRRVEQAARDLGLAIEVQRMGVSTRTAEDAARACGCVVAQIVKSLVFQGEQGLILLLVSGANRVDTRFVSETIDDVLERADPVRVRAVTGFAIGGVAPIGHLLKPSIWMDRDLLDFTTVWAAAGAPDAVFEIEPRALRDATDAEIIAMTPPD